MKTFIHAICIILAVIMQISLFPQITIFGGMPNLILLTMLILIFIGRRDEALIWLAFGGLMLEMVSTAHFGYYFFPLLATYFAIVFLVKKLFTNPSWYLAIILFLLSSIFVDLVWLIYSFSLSSVQIILADAIYNSILGMIIYYFMHYYYLPKEKITI